MLKLNNDQEIVYKQIIDFINSDKKYFLLTGSAGTGKTTLITRCLSHPKLENYKVALTGCTNQAVNVLEKCFMKLYEKTTENQHEILKKPEEISCLTIHKLLKIKRKIDLKGKEIFHSNLGDENTKVKSKSIYYYNLIIIDEVSMLNQDLTLKLLELQNKISGKIIFVGDQAQLPPVNEKNSYIFQIAGKEIPHGHLSEVMRSDNLITKFTNSVRKLALEESNKLSFKNYGNERVFFYKNEDNWLDEYLKNIKDEQEVNQDTTSILLSYTNREIDRFNRIIRNKLFNNPIDIYTQGEKIVFLNHYNSLNGYTYFSSETAIIGTIEETEIHFPNIFFYDLFNYNCDIKDLESRKEKDGLNQLFNLIRKSNNIIKKDIKKDTSIEKSDDEISDNEDSLDNDTKNINLKVNLDKFCQICYLDFEKKNTKGKQCNLNSNHIYCPMCYKNWIISFHLCPLCYVQINDDGLITCPESDILSSELEKFQKEFNTINYKIWLILLNNQGIIKVIHKENEKLYIEGLNKCRSSLENISLYLEKVKINNSEQSFERNIFQTNPRLKLFFQQLLQRLWDLFYYHYIDQFASISYGYAITTHRSQGSTYDNIFIYLKDIIMNNRNQLEAYHCFYTASTRASKKLHILY
jgi:hypothetical protein